MLRNSKRKTEGDADIKIEGTDYNQGHIYCFYQKDIDGIYVFPLDLDIYDILDWSGVS
jgi:hypothetical protein